MINMDCKHMTYQERPTFKDFAIAGVEFVCAMACGLGLILVLALVTNVGG